MWFYLVVDVIVGIVGDGVWVRFGWCVFVLFVVGV